MMTRISVPLTTEERELLRQIATKNLREPREHARYILRSALLGEQFQESKNPSTVSLPDRTVNGFAVSQP